MALCRPAPLSKLSPKLGPLLFMSGIQYFLVQLIVAGSFSPSFSLAHNTISDLGNTVCGAYSNRMVCSPLHPLMNLSFIVLGLTILIGSALLSNRFRSARVGLSLFAAGGLGVILVGLFPENTVPALHGLGAALPFFVGNVGLLVLSWQLDVPKALRLFTRCAAVLSLVALVMYESGHSAGVGEGAIERVVAYPQTIWMIVLGAYCLIRRD